MIQLCQTNQIGHVSSVKHVGTNLAFSIASDMSYKKDGKWQDKAH